MPTRIRTSRPWNKRTGPGEVPALAVQLAHWNDNRSIRALRERTALRSLDAFARGRAAEAPGMRGADDATTPAPGRQSRQASGSLGGGFLVRLFRHWIPRSRANAIPR